MKEIGLTRGMIALVDDEDYEWLNQWKWCIRPDRNTNYAIRSIPDEKGGWDNKHTQSMHRLIMGITNSNIQVDHIDHDGLNNQKNNLRVCSNRQNRMNSLKSCESLCKHKGVTKRRKKPHNRWRYVARIRVNGNLINIGVFDTEKEAAMAYDKMALKYFGEFAYLNYNYNERTY